MDATSSPFASTSSHRYYDSYSSPSSSSIIGGHTSNTTNTPSMGTPSHSTSQHIGVTSTNMNNMTIDQRIAHARKTLELATKEALKLSDYHSTVFSSSTTRLMMTEKQQSGDQTLFQNDYHDITTEQQQEEDGQTSSHNLVNEKESFELGMYLFGGEDAAFTTTISDQIQDVQTDLNHLLGTLRESQNDGINDDGNNNSHNSIDSSITTTDHSSSDFSRELKRMQRNYHEEKEKQEQEQVMGDGDNQEQTAKEEREDDDEENNELQMVQILSTKIDFLKRCSKALESLEESKNNASCDNIVGPAQALANSRSILVSIEEDLNKRSMHDKNRKRQQNTVEQQIAKKIITSIRNQIRSQIVDTLVIVNTILQNYITISSSSLKVGNINGSSNSGKKIPTSSSSESKQKRGKLGDAFAVLGILQGTDTNSGEETYLDNAVQTILKNVMDLILTPVLDSFIGNHENRDNQSSHSSDLKSSNQHEPKWHFFESNTGNIEDDDNFVSSLEWKLSVDNDTFVATTANNNTTTLEQQHVWCDVLRTIETVLTFVYKSVFFQRPELSSRLGRYLYYEDSNSNSVDDNSQRLNTDTSSTSLTVELRPNYIRGPLLDRLLKLCWDMCIPSCSELTTSTTGWELTTKLIQAATLEFEKSLLSKNIIVQKELEQASNSDPVVAVGPLSSFVSNLEEQYAEKKRVDVLTKGRAILFTDYHNTVMVGGNNGKNSNNNNVSATTSSNQDDKDTTEGLFMKDFNNIDPTHLGPDMDPNPMSIYVLPRCAISNVAYNLIEHVKSTLNEATTSSTNNENNNDSTSANSKMLATTLYKASRELLDLFRAIIPTTQGNVTSTIPRCAAILHNDCVYISHILHSLGLKYRERMPPPLDKLCTFVDMIPPFRELADTVLCDMVERQKLQLAEIVFDRCEGLQLSLKLNEGGKVWSEAETGVRGAHYNLQQLSQAWKENILPSEVYCRAMGSLIDTLLSLLLDPVMKAEDISESASHFVSSLYRSALNTRDILPTVGDGSGSDVEKDKLARSSCAYWERFAAVGSFMDMSLIDVANGLANGTFRTLTGAELSRLLMATFDDSEKRKRLLAALAD